MRVGIAGGVQFPLRRNVGGKAADKKLPPKEDVGQTHTDTSRLRRSLRSRVSGLPHCGQTDRNTERPVVSPNPQEEQPRWNRGCLTPLPHCFRRMSALLLTGWGCSQERVCARDRSTLRLRGLL